MATIRFDLNKEYCQKLKNDAKEKHMSLQDYIRFKLFGLTTIFSVDEAVRRTQAGDFANTEKYPDGFTLPDVYGDEWTIERGPAGVFGKNFYNYTEGNPGLGIKFKDMGKNGRRAHYTYKRGEYLK